jgi:hypothetical protein
MARKNSKQKRICEAKVKHASKEAAQSVVGSLFTLYEQCTHPYKCKFCGKWHVGSNKKQKFATQLRKLNKDKI